MKKILSVLLLSAVLVLSMPGAASAAATIPVGSCPVGYQPQDAMMHDMSGHMHAGLEVDLNGDGIICVKKVTDTIHVHVDNTILGY